MRIVEGNRPRCWLWDPAGKAQCLVEVGEDRRHDGDHAATETWTWPQMTVADAVEARLLALEAEAAIAPPVA